MKRDTSARSNLSRYSKHTFSSMNYSKERAKKTSDTFSIASDFSTKKLRKVGSQTATFTKSQTKAGKKGTKSTKQLLRNTSSKRQLKKYAKVVKYASPGKKLKGENYSYVTKKSLANFKKQYLSKSAWGSKSMSKDLKMPKKSSKKSNKSKKSMPGMKQVVSGQNIKLRTVNLADSRNYEDISMNSTGSYRVMVNQPQGNAFGLKKSSTMTDLRRDDIPVQNLVKHQPQSRTDSINFYN